MTMADQSQRMTQDTPTPELPELQTIPVDIMRISQSGMTHVCTRQVFFIIEAGWRSANPVPGLEHKYRLFWLDEEGYIKSDVYRCVDQIPKRSSELPVLAIWCDLSVFRREQARLAAAYQRWFLAHVGDVPIWRGEVGIAKLGNLHFANIGCGYADFLRQCRQIKKIKFHRASKMEHYEFTAAVRRKRMDELLEECGGYVISIEKQPFLYEGGIKLTMLLRKDEIENQRRWVGAHQDKLWKVASRYLADPILLGSEEKIIQLDHFSPVRIRFFRPAPEIEFTWAVRPEFAQEELERYRDSLRHG